jgi:hypothetical protein
VFVAVTAISTILYIALAVFAILVEILHWFEFTAGATYSVCIGVFVTDVLCDE